MLHGELVNLRAIERSDGELVWRWVNDPELMRTWGCAAATSSRDLIFARIESWIAEEHALAHPIALVIEALDGSPVGLMVLSEVELAARSATLSLFIAETRDRSRGIGRDAVSTLADAFFDQWGYHRLSARAEAANEGAIAFYQRLGFAVEGRLREASYIDGAFHDQVCFGLLATDPRPDDG